MKTQILTTIFAVSLLAALSTASRADDAKLETEADQASTSAKQSDDLAKAGKQEVQAAKEHGQELVKKINEAELSKFKTDGDIQKLRQDFQRLAQENEISEGKLKTQMGLLEKHQGEALAQKEKNEEENTRLKKDVQDLKDKLSAQEDATRLAESQGKTAKNENEKSKDEKSDLIKKIEKANHAKAKLDEEIKYLAADHEQFVRDTKVQEEKLRMAEASLEQRQFQADTMHTKVSEENAQLKDKIAELKDSVSTKNASVKDAEEQLNSEKKEVAKTKDERADLNKNIEQSEKARLKLEAETLQMKNEKQKLLSEIQSMTIKIHGLESRARIADKDNARATEEKEAVKTQNDGLRHDVETKEADVKNLEQMMDAGKEELKDAKKEHDELIRRNQQSQSEKSRLSAEVAQIKRDYERLQIENRILAAKAERDDQEMMAQQTKKQNLQRSISSLKNKNDH